MRRTAAVPGPIHIIRDASRGVKPLAARSTAAFRPTPGALTLAALAACVSLTPRDIAAGPWTRPREGYFAKFAASYLYTRTELDAAGSEVPVLTSNPLVQSAAYREVALSTYAEYGLSDRWTLVGSLPYKIVTSTRTEISEDASLLREIDATNAGLSDLHLGARGALRRGRYPVAVEAGVKIPLGYERVPENGGPALGSGEPDVQAALSAGTGAASVYTQAWAAYRVRGGELDDDVGFGIEAGGRRGRLFAQALVEGWYSTGEIEPLDVSATTMAVNQDVLKLIASAGARTGRQASVVVEVFHVLDGRNTAAGTTWSLGLVLEAP